MIDKKQLKQLGWSDELISEVTRMSSRIEDSVKQTKEIEEPFDYEDSGSGNSIRYSSEETNTGINLFFDNNKLK